MSWVIRDININLSTQDLNRAIREIEQIRTRILPAADQLVRNLATLGEAIAQAELLIAHPPAYYFGDLYNSIHADVKRTHADITAGEGLVDGYGNSYAVHVEFGTGVHTSGGGGRQDGWVYYNNRDNKFHWTDGMEPRPFMQNTFRKLKDEAETSGWRVIAEYLAKG